MTSPVPRPFNVTVVVMITWLIAIMSLLTGLNFLMSDALTLVNAGMTNDEANIYGLVELCYGLVVGLVAVGLSHGNNLSRFLVTALMIARLIASAYAAWVLVGFPEFWVAAAILVLAVVALALLYSASANEFFAIR